jgi:hypothetical protein
VTAASLVPLRYERDIPTVELMQLEDSSESLTAVTEWLMRVTGDEQLEVQLVPGLNGGGVKIDVPRFGTGYLVPFGCWIMASFSGGNVACTVHDRQPNLYGYVEVPLPVDPEPEPTDYAATEGSVVENSLERIFLDNLDRSLDRGDMS